MIFSFDWAQLGKHVVAVHTAEGPEIQKHESATQVFDCQIAIAGSEPSVANQRRRVDN
jgi:hypothetical protein